eukprot:GHVS01011927.1.p1 GENE.GHVS01011927.1~~GHVS01011927.1.p1  ORF type:complete len:305 (-),score=51.55 GHVS01011927.1:80-994(-)
MSSVFVPRFPSFSSFRYSCRQLYLNGLTKDKARNLFAVGLSFSFFTCGWVSCKKVPGGHIGIVEDWNGNVRHELYDDDHLFFFIPVYQKAVVIRLFPVKKRLTRICYTKDEQSVEVCLQIRLQPKIAFCRDIYLRLGRDYARAFVENEAVVDIENIVRKFTYDQLVHNNDNTDDTDNNKKTDTNNKTGNNSKPSAPPAKALNYSEVAVDEMVSCFKDACSFHRLILTETTVLFKNPNEEEQLEEDKDDDDEANKDGNKKKEGGGGGEIAAGGELSRDNNNSKYDESVQRNKAIAKGYMHSESVE